MAVINFASASIRTHTWLKNTKRIVFRSFSHRLEMAMQVGSDAIWFSNMHSEYETKIHHLCLGVHDVSSQDTNGTRGHVTNKVTNKTTLRTKHNYTLLLLIPFNSVSIKCGYIPKNIEVRYSYF